MKNININIKNKNSSCKMMVMCMPQPRFLFPGIFSPKSMFYALKIKCENGQNYKLSL